MNLLRVKNLVGGIIERAANRLQMSCEDISPELRPYTSEAVSSAYWWRLFQTIGAQRENPWAFLNFENVEYVFSNNDHVSGEQHISQ